MNAGLLISELLVDSADWVFNYGTDRSLGCFAQIIQWSFACFAQGALSVDPQGNGNGGGLALYLMILLDALLAGLGVDNLLIAMD